MAINLLPQSLPQFYGLKIPKAMEGRLLLEHPEEGSLHQSVINSADRLKLCRPQCLPGHEDFPAVLSWLLG